MAGMQGIGVNVWANTAQLVEGVNKAISQFSRMETAIKRIGGIMGVAFSVNQIVSFTKNTLEAADALVENAQKAGISAANLKLYSMAAELSGTETKALMTGIGILSKNMAGLSKEGSGAVKALEEMGINTKTVKGELLPTEAVLMQVADKFAVMKDGAGKTATAMALFGKAGKELIPFLNEGSKGVADLQSKLEGLGVKFDELSLQKAAALNDELKILEFAWENLGKQIVMGAVPAIWDVANAMGKASIQGDIFKSVGEGVGSMFKEMSLTALSTAEEIQKLFAIFEWMQKKGDEWKNKPFFDRFFFGGDSKVPSVGPQLSAIASQYAERRKALEAGTPFTAPKKKTGAAPDIANVASGHKKVVDEAEKAMDALRKLGVEHQKQDLDDWFKTSEEKRKLVQEFSDAYMKSTMNAFDYELQQLEKDREMYAKVITDKAKLDEWYNAKKQEIETKRAEENQRMMDDAARKYEHQLQLEEKLKKLKEETWASEHEVMNAMREAWGLTYDEIYEGSVNTWTEVADVITSASEQMSATLSNVMVGFIDGTVNARQAVESLSKSILQNVIQALIKIGVQQVILATIGNTIQMTSSAAIVASMQAVYASASAAAAALSMATFGASAAAGSAAYIAGMGSSMAFSQAMGQGIFGQPQGMAQGGIINEHIIGRGASGRLYQFGEEGPERVTPMRGRKSASTINININGAVLNNYDELARVLVPAIRKAEYDGV